ncbi:MAG TPA: FGGY family carbohydrate kinase [Gammaproteobacteria bacterium]|nr:FGGY family carbohydrate kinase [Gammaproteobacteria bacterium]
MSDNVVIGVDVSTTAVKAIAWNGAGAAIAEARRPLPLDRPGTGRYEQNAETWWIALCDCLKDLAGRLTPGSVAALAIAHQRETFVTLDASGKPSLPALLWLDARAEQEVADLRETMSDRRYRAITGKTPNYGPALFKLAWVGRHAPDSLRRAAAIADVQSFLVARLCGEFVTSRSSADPLGLFDLQRQAWDEGLCGWAGIEARQLPRVEPPGTLVGTLDAAAAEATDLPEATPVVLAGGDGQTGGLGINATSPQRTYLNLGTAVVAGIYSDEPLHDPAWRTLCAGGSRGYYLESSLRSGALLSDWFLQSICNIVPERDPDALKRLERDAESLPPGANGLLLLPYWEGVMNPHWDEQARGCVLGLATSHDRAALYRALIEGVAMEQALFLDAAARSGAERPRELAAVGGLSASDLWCQLTADVTGIPVARSPSAEAASLGAAMCAAAGVGWFESPEAAADAMSAAATDAFQPDAQAHGRYRDLTAIYGRLYGTIRDLQHELGRFRDQATAS